MNNIADFDSHEEWYFDLWLQELISAGLIDRIKYHPLPFTLSDNINLSFELKMATKTKEESITLLNGHQYQADWVIYWNDKATNIMFADRVPLPQSPKKYPFFSQWSSKRNQHYSVIDIKGSFSGKHNNSAVTFPLNQKWTYQKYKIYVQKIILTPRITKGKMIPANALFVKTFVPRRYLLTDESGKNRKINFKYVLCQQFLRKHGLRQ